MKTIVSRSGSLILVDDDDYERLKCFNWSIRKQNDWTFYASCSIDGKAIQMHRMILDAPAGMVVDHKDHNGLNNQKVNLRICTVRQNAYNRIALHKNNTGFKGVHYDKFGKSYQVCIKTDTGKIRRRFKKLSDAVLFYDEQARKYFGEFAFTNIRERSPLLNGLPAENLYFIGRPYFFMNKPKQVVRCQGSIHTKHEGNILIAYSGSEIFVKCNDRDCKRWTKITITIPGLKIDLSEAGIAQEVMPPDYHLHLEPATSVVLERSR